MLRLLNSARSDNNNFDCVVAVSGGKDGSYVSYNLKHKYNMNPLAVTIRPITETKIGQDNQINLANFDTKIRI